MTSLIKIEFEIKTPKEAIRKLKVIEEKLLKGIFQDDDFKILLPNGEVLV